MSQTQSRLMSDVWAGCLLWTPRASLLSLEASPLDTERVCSPRGQPYFSELDIFLLGEVEAESRPGWLLELEPSECRMRTMEPRQTLANTSHVENLDFFFLRGSKTLPKRQWMKKVNVLTETWAPNLLLFLSFKQKARAEAVTFFLPLWPLSTPTHESSESLVTSTSCPFASLPTPTSFSFNFL